MTQHLTEKDVRSIDIEGESFSQKTALKNAPKQQDGSFLIPAILGGGDA